MFMEHSNLWNSTKNPQSKKLIELKIHWKKIKNFRGHFFKN